MPTPISLSDQSFDQITSLTKVLTPEARSGFLEALAGELQAEEVQPVGDGAVFRISRQLLRTGQFKRADTYHLVDNQRNDTRLPSPSRKRHV
jgi:hypothetical protein